MRRLLKLLVVGAAVAVVAAYLLRPTPETIVYVSPASVEVLGPVSAGSPLTLSADMDGVDGPVEIVAFSGGSVLRLTLDFGPGRHIWTVPEAISNTAGHLTLLVGERQVDLNIPAGQPEAATEILLGPRTIVADGEDSTLAVIAPGDLYGNAMPAGTAVGFQRLDPGNSQSTQATTVWRSIAWTHLIANTVAGANSVWVTTGGTTGVPAVLSEVPGFAASVELELETSTFAADGRQVIELATGPLADAFGNELPDGVAGVFRLTTATTTTVVPAAVQRGRLRAFWTAPNSPVVLSIEASVNGQTSDAEIITAVSAAQTFSVAGQLTDDGYRVDVGPILDPSGALVSDGTEVLIGNRSTTTTDGRASALVQADPGMISITVLGRVVEHRIAP